MTFNLGWVYASFHIVRNCVKQSKESKEMEILSSILPSVYKMRVDSNYSRVQKLYDFSPRYNEKLYSSILPSTDNNFWYRSPSAQYKYRFSECYNYN